MRSLDVQEIIGLSYNPLAKTYSLGRDTDVNYLGPHRRRGLNRACPPTPGAASWRAHRQGRNSVHARMASVH